MKSIITTLTLMAASVIGASAQQETMVFDLREQSNFTRCTQTSLVYDRYDSYYDQYDEAWSFNYSNNCPYMCNNSYAITDGYYDDYLITPDLELHAGELYCIYTSPSAYSSYATQKPDMKVWYGQGASPEGYTLLKELNGIINNSKLSAEVHQITFNVPADGNYRVAFEGIKYKMYLYETYIVSLGSSNVPATVADLAVLPDADGGNSVALSFTMPSATTSGMELTGDLGYNIYRGEELMQSGNAAAGTPVMWTDAAAPSGNVTYSVEIANGGDVSEKITVTTFVGAETPLGVENLQLVSDGETNVLTWVAPATGEHGASLAPDKLRYTVTRVLGDEEQTVADGIAETSFTETLPNNGLKTLSYKVVVSLNGNSSEAVESNKVKIGRLDLPFADSFAGGDLSENWETEIVSGTYNWTIGSIANYPTTEPFDADGGLIYYPSFNAQAGQTARLITVPLSRESANSPVLQFYLCHSNMGNDKVQVQVSCDNGAWVDVEGEMPVVKGDKGVWEQYLFPLSGALTDGCKSFRVSLTAVSAYGHNIVVDNVRIFNLVDYDLEAVSLVGADKVLAGNDVELTLTIANNGGRDVSAGDYLIHVTSDLGTEIVSPASADIKSMETAALTVKVPVNAVHALAAESYIFKAEIDYPSDEVAGNNVTADKVVALGFSENDCVKSLSISADASGNKVLSWEPAGDPTYQPVNISESFEEFEKDAAGSFNGIVVLDLDGKSGGTNYGASGSAFTVSEHNSTYPKNEDGSKYIALTLPASTQQDDWVILPAVSCKASSTMTLSFMVALKAFYSSVSYYNYSYEVVYSTGDYDAANPSAAFTNLIKKETSSSTYGDLLHNDSFIEMTYENIPAEARHVAIHFTTKTGAVTAVCVDNIRLTEVDCARLLGYHVYEHQVGRINAEMLGADVTTFSLSQARFAAPSLRSVKDPVRQYFVTAVYPDGESMPSNIVSDGNMSGVENVADAASEVTAVAGGIVIKCGGEETVEVYDVAGRLVVAATCDGETFIPLHASVYVVKVGDAVAGKVLVK